MTWKQKHFGRIGLTAILGGLIVSSSLCSLRTVEARSAVPNLLQLITNSPPISSLVFRYRFGRQPAELCEFRVQSNAFFGRITTNSSFNNEFSPQDTLFGRWEDDYWFYTHTPAPRDGLPPPPPVLHRYQFDPDDTHSIAYQSVNRYFLTRFRLFTSLGVAGDSAPGSLIVNQDNTIIYKSPAQGITITAELKYSNALPVSAEMELMVDGHALKGRAEYGYRPEIAFGSIPAYINSSSCGIIEVLSVSFAAGEKPMEKELFTPPDKLLAASSLSVRVHSNHTELTYLQGQLVSRRDYTPDERVRASQAAQSALIAGVKVTEDQRAISQKRYLIIFLLAGTSFLILLLIVRLNQNKKKI